jgi:uncharacterized protein (TIGR02452 family)
MAAAGAGAGYKPGKGRGKGKETYRGGRPNRFEKINEQAVEITESLKTGGFAKFLEHSLVHTIHLSGLDDPVLLTLGEKRLQAMKAAKEGTVPPKLVIRVVNSDTLDQARLLIDAGLNPLAVNMASDRVPGGGWWKGSQAQEESLVRRCTLYENLMQQHIRSKYPLNAKNPVVIYSPNTIVFCDSNYEPLKPKDRFSVGIISVPFVRLNASYAAKKFSPEDAKLTFDKIRMIFKTAFAHGHDALVLGASGCGAFHNPPAHVALLYKKAIDELPNGIFKSIDFAILTDHNDRNGNRKAFEDVFKNSDVDVPDIKAVLPAAAVSSTKDKSVLPTPKEKSKEAVDVKSHAPVQSTKKEVEDVDRATQQYLKTFDVTAKAKVTTTDIVPFLTLAQQTLTTHAKANTALLSIGDDDEEDRPLKSFTLEMASQCRCVFSFETKLPAEKKPFSKPGLALHLTILDEKSRNETRVLSIVPTNKKKGGVMSLSAFQKKDDDISFGNVTMVSDAQALTFELVDKPTFTWIDDVGFKSKGPKAKQDSRLMVQCVFDYMSFAS